jgi:hypothetical protein
MMSRSNNAARGQNKFSKMALEEKSLATPDIKVPLKLVRK